MFPSVWHPNTQIHNTQIQFWSNYQIDLTMWFIFEKEIVQGPRKQCSQVKNKNLENLENLET